jgi:hypothetical protein
VPNALITWPAAAVPSLPCKRIKRVEATFKDSRKSVTINKTEGKTENCSGFKTYMDINRIIMEKVRLKESRISNKKVGIGMIITIKIAITPIAITAELDFAESRKVPLTIASEFAIIPYPNILTCFCS